MAGSAIKAGYEPLNILRNMAGSSKLVPLRTLSKAAGRKGAESSVLSSISRWERPLSVTIAMRPARLSVTPRISWNCCDPVSQYMPFSRRESQESFMALKSSGAY